MRKLLLLTGIALVFSAFPVANAKTENITGQVKKAVEKCTLDQPGTKPFHLKAEFAPSLERDKDSHRTGEIEIWWESPTRWRREVRSPDFHQVDIVDGTHQWQKNDGDYFPDWLRELAVAIVRPVPLQMDVLLTRVKTAEVRRLAGQTNLDWDPVDGPGEEQANGKGHLALMDQTGLLFYTGGPGWDGLYHDFKDFHGRMIARSVASGFIEVTAKVSILEDLGATPADFFNASAAGGDAQPIETVVLSEADLRKNLILGKPMEWPAVEQGPFQGTVWTEVVLDRTGNIREMIPPISDNPALADAAERGFRAMQFQPVTRNGIPVQAWGRLSFRFETARPAGMETFLSAREYFERGRKASFLAAGATAPYLLRAEFQVGTPDGVQTGRYEDTWINATEWKREAWVGSSHFVRSESGGKYYVLSEGSRANVLRMILQLLEPIPAADTMTESDWKVDRDTVDGVKTVRVTRGPEGPNGEMEPGKSEGFWFDERGQLVKSYTDGLVVHPTNVEPYNGVQIARRIEFLKDGKAAAIVTVKEIGPANPSAAKKFKLKGHEGQRAFTAEAR
jgi:hypothetical protein